jgi:hypothetical protein
MRCHGKLCEAAWLRGGAAYFVAVVLSKRVALNYSDQLVLNCGEVVRANLIQTGAKVCASSATHSPTTAAARGVILPADSNIRVL